MRVLIPTRNRPELIQKASLAYLDRCGFPPEMVDIWISGEDQIPQYEIVPQKWKDRFRIGVKGLQENRAFAEKSYPQGTEIFWMNDDIFEISGLTEDGKKLREVKLQDVLAEGFAECKKAGAHLWGIYAVRNPFYMADKVHHDLRYIVGCAYGTILLHEDRLTPKFGDAKEDYERAMRFYQRDDVIVRIDRYAPKTIYYNSPEIFPNVEKIEKNIQELERCWPGWVTRNTRKKSKYPEINIKDPLRAKRGKA